MKTVIRELKKLGYTGKKTKNSAIYSKIYSKFRVTMIHPSSSNYWSAYISIGSEDISNMIIFTIDELKDYVEYINKFLKKYKRNEY